MATIQIRNVPAEVHDQLQRRASNSGRSLQQYMLDAVCREAEMASMEELLARNRAEALAYGEIDLDPEIIVEIIRSDRESH